MKTALSRSVMLTISVLFLALGACSKEPDNAAAEKPPAVTVDDIPTAASPLAIAAISGDLAKIRSLLEAGAEIETTDALGRTPLHMAAFYGRTRATELLLASGATIEVRDRIGMTPLHAAVLAGGRHVVELLLDRKADPNARTDTGQTPLHLAAATGQPRVARLLIERGVPTRRARTSTARPRSSTPRATSIRSRPKHCSPMPRRTTDCASSQRLAPARGSAGGTSDQKHRQGGLADQAFLIASSRSSRRRILPTLVFGNSVRNSTWPGTL